VLDRNGIADRRPFDSICTPWVSLRYVGRLVSIVYSPKVAHVPAIMLAQTAQEVRILNHGVWPWGNKMGQEVNYRK
jgi:hypothetical protein